MTKLVAAKAHHLIAAEVEFTVLGDHGRISFRAGLLPGRVVLDAVNLDYYPTSASQQHEEVHALARQWARLPALRPGVRVIVKVHLRHERWQLESMPLEQLGVLLEHQG